MTTLSLILPVYAVEATIERCVESIRSQSFEDWEVILVDDGSPDASAAMCDTLAATDERIRAVHQENAGLSAARNAGLRVARGEYVTFVDTDDYLAPDTLAPLIEELRERPELDILEYSFVRHKGGEDEELVVLDRATFADFPSYWFGAQGYAHCYACNKLFRRAILPADFFAEGQTFEDVDAMLRLLLPTRLHLFAGAVRQAEAQPERAAKLKKAPTIGTTPCGTYVYTANPRGITRNASARSTLDLLRPHAQLLRLLAQCPVVPIEPAALASYYAAVLNIQIDVERSADAASIAKRERRLLPPPPALRRHVRTTSAALPEGRADAVRRPLAYWRHPKVLLLQLTNLPFLCQLLKHLPRRS